MSELNPVDIHVGKRLRLGRTMQGMSQENVGDAIGVTFQQIQKYERGINCIRSRKLYELAKALKVTVSFFFDGLNEVDASGKYSIPGAADGKSEFEADYASSRETIELMNAFRRIPNSKKRSFVTNLAQAMADDKTMVG